MELRLEPVRTEDLPAIRDIFNYYIENSFAAYLEMPVPLEFFGTFLRMVEGYPFLAAKDSDGRLLGFGLLRPYNPMPAFSRTAEITYFVSPEFTRHGIGGMLLDRLLAKACEMGITSILASISSLNPPSLSFHESHGFEECGRFAQIGRKKGQGFDVVWMQKMV
jgi:phosphinothricin acetyltransferase